MPHVRSVSVGVWIRNGSRREVPEENGLAHFIEHMVFKGTERRSAEDDCAGDGFGRRDARRVHLQGTDLLQRQGAGRASCRSRST